MPTKAQSKAAIDAAAVAMKNDIDTTLPAVGGGIKDGSLTFGPTRWTVVLDAGGVQATADAWLATLKTNLTNQARSFKAREFKGRREDDPADGNRLIRVETDLATYIIQNF